MKKIKKISRRRENWASGLDFYQVSGIISGAVVIAALPCGVESSSAPPSFFGLSKVVVSFSSLLRRRSGALDRLVVIDGRGLHVLVARDVGRGLHAEEAAVLGHARVPELVQRPVGDLHAISAGTVQTATEPAAERVRRVLLAEPEQTGPAEVLLAHRVPG